jgi:hypothetical protein
MQAQARVTAESVNFEVQGDQRSVDVDVVLEFNGLVKKIEEYTFTTRAVRPGRRVAPVATPARSP